VGAFSLQEAKTTQNTASQKSKTVEFDGKRVSSKDVRQTIKSIAAAETDGGDVDMPAADSVLMDEDDEDFVPQPSKTQPEEASALPTLKSLAAMSHSGSSKLFAPYTFWLSRETSRPVFEFIVRSFGGRIGWPATSGSGSPFDETDESITHVIIDRPLVERPNETEEERERRRRRKYVQPQWVVDCINAGKILLEEPYLQGKTLPPHLSPFGDHTGTYDPTAGLTGEDVDMEQEVSEESEQEQDEDEGSDAEEVAQPDKAALKAAAAAEDEAALRAAELEAEAAGVDFSTFEKEARKAQKKTQKAETKQTDAAEEDMNKMMMSNKQRKLYERMKYGEKKRAAERQNLEEKRKAIEKEKRRKSKA